MRGGTLGGWTSQPPFLDNVAKSQCSGIGRAAICPKSGLSGAHWHQLRVTILLEEKPLVDWASHNYIDLFAKFQNPSNSQIGPVYLDVITVPWKLLFLFLYIFCVHGVLFVLSVYLGDICFSFMFVIISHWSLSVIYCALIASLPSNFKTKLFQHKTVVMMGDAHGGIHQFKWKRCSMESDGHSPCCHQHCDESRCQSSFSHHTEIRMSRRADEEGAGGEDCLLVLAAMCYLCLLCISALVKAATPHFTHLMAALSCPLLNPKSWICSVASTLVMAISVSSKETSCDSLLRGGVCKGAFYLKVPTWRDCLLKCKIFLFKGEVENDGESAFIPFQKEKQKSESIHKQSFPSTLVTLRWFWSPRARLSSMFSFLPVRGTLPSCLPHSSWPSTRRVLGPEWEDLYPSDTSSPCARSTNLWALVSWRSNMSKVLHKTYLSCGRIKNHSVWRWFPKCKLAANVLVKSEVKSRRWGSEKQSCRDLIARRLENSVARWWQSGEGTEVHWYEPRKDNPRGQFLGPQLEQMWPWR